jgi:hypothetical protein
MSADTKGEEPAFAAVCVLVASMEESAVHRNLP